MTALAGPAVIPDRTGRWLVCGVAFSLVLHGLAVAAWLWQPQTTLTPMSPAAVPMVGPVTSPTPQPMQDVGPAQPEVSVNAPKSDRLSVPRQGQTKAAKISWQQQLHAHLERHKRCPRKARRLGKEGMPRISFSPWIAAAKCCRPPWWAAVALLL